MRPVYFAVFTVSAGLIAFQISLLQVLSIVQWHHFASLIISVALLGFGASGTVLSLARRWMVERFDRILPLLLAGSVAMIALAVPASQTEIAQFDSYLVFVQTKHAVALLLTCLILAFPFFLGALAIGLTFVRFTDHIGSLYFWNLVGSGIGGALALALMWTADPQVIAPLSGLFAAAGAFPVAAKVRSKSVQAAVSAAPLICVALIVYPFELSPSQFKDISRALDLPDAQVIFRRPSPQGLIEVVSAPAARNAPGLSLKYTGDVPVRDMVFVNGDGVGALPHNSHLVTTSIYDYSTRALPYEMSHAGQVLVLSSGTGEAVRHAEARGAKHIRAVEPHGALTSLWMDTSPVVDATTVQARTWLESDSAHYDLIVFPDVGRFGGTVGLEEMEEEYLMTRQALRTAWDRLRPGGRIAVTVWIDYPYRAPLQVLSSLMDTLTDEVSDPVEHVAAIRSWSDVTFTISRARITPSVSDSIRAFSESRGFDPLLLPDVKSNERDRFNELSDDSLLDYVDRLVRPDRDTFISTYPFIIAPTTDDQPFAMRFLRWDALPAVIRSFGDHTAPFFGLGLFIAILALIMAIVLSVVLIVVPLLAFRTERRGSLRTFLYFGALGLAYFFVEIVFIQRFTLFLGHAVYAATAVISVMLIGSGLGSYFSSRLAAGSKSVSTVAGLVAVVTLVCIPLLEILFGAAISLSIGWRAVMSLLLILPPAFVMGFPFPLGLRSVAAFSEAHVPWAWGVNGCLSVVGAAGAGLLALEFGFTAVLVTAAVSYGVAAVATVIPRIPM